MTDGRTAGPRRLGLLTEVNDLARPTAGRQRFPYALGDRIAGDLTVVGHLAAGRFGHLYQVWSAKRWCAFTCKILGPDFAEDRHAVAAFRRESRILRRLHHPNVVRSYGEGRHDGLPYILMEYVDGPSLFDLIEQRPRRRLGVADAVRAATHVGASLYHLHRSGYLHLDLKPANLLLRDSVPVLVDFDVARRIQPPKRPREVLGTAPYMAPEQVRRDPPTPASDVYGLGAVLYELVTGRWPFEDVFTGEERRKGEERYYPQLGDRPPPPPRRYDDSVSSSLNRTILRCLEPDPGKRFPSMHALLLALTKELPEPVAFWPQEIETERRRQPRDD